MLSKMSKGKEVAGFTAAMNKSKVRCVECNHPVTIIISTAFVGTNNTITVITYITFCRMALLVSVVTMFLVMATWTLGLLSVYIVKSMEYVFAASQVVLALFLLAVHCCNSQVASYLHMHTLHTLYSLVHNHYNDVIPPPPPSYCVWLRNNYSTRIDFSSALSTHIQLQHTLLHSNKCLVRSTEIWLPQLQNETDFNT